ncbi:MAG: hypothetical protein K1X72_17515 [Pyrinomonadaceae bacterium]|nr:hypothetical protein [Pyrinomonadaceae bacterium]
MPEINGFHLGMTFDEVNQKFGLNCNLVQKYTVKEGFSEAYKQSHSITHKYLFSIETDSHVPPNIVQGKTGCWQPNNSAIWYKPNDFPDLKDISSMALLFDENKRVTTIEFSYQRNKGSLSPSQLAEKFGLEKWTWKTRNQTLESYWTASICQLECKNLTIKSVIFNDTTNDYNFTLTIDALTDAEAEEFNQVFNKEYKLPN